MFMFIVIISVVLMLIFGIFIIIKITINSDNSKLKNQMKEINKHRKMMREKGIKIQDTRE